MDYIDLPNLASPLLRSRIVFATDEWFAAADNVIRDEEPVWKQDDYTPFGKWMDGWESRRRRTEGHDWAIIKLGIPGIIRAIEIDTAFFTGNFSPKASVYATCSADESIVQELLNFREESVLKQPEFGRMGLKASEEEWVAVNHLKSEDWPQMIPLTRLGAGYEASRRNLFRIESAEKFGPVSFLRLNMGPDGGIARIRVFGEVLVNPEKSPSGDEVFDLASIYNGGLAISCSNKHYGHPRNLIAPGRGNCMGDGWETARQPKRPPVYKKDASGLLELPGFEWSVIRLGVQGIVDSIEVDTHFYRGNYPESCMIEALCCSGDSSNASITQSLVKEEGHANFSWKLLLPRVRLGPDERHFFNAGEFNDVGPITHIKVTMFPDGGIMRIRIMGKRSASGPSSGQLRAYI